MNKEQKRMLYILKANKHRLSRQTLKTIKGQVLSGDTIAAEKG